MEKGREVEVVVPSIWLKEDESYVYWPKQNASKAINDYMMPDFAKWTEIAVLRVKPRGSKCSFCLRPIFMFVYFGLVLPFES